LPTKEESARVKWKTMRIPAFDIFRGLVIALMILANTGILQESTGNGLLIGDIIQPMFIFIIGLVIPYSLSKRVSESRNKTLVHLIIRTVILFSIGLFLNAYPYFNIGTLRIMSVLQRLALCYLFTSLVYMFTKPRYGIIICTAIFVLYSFSGTLPTVIDRSVLANHMYVNGVNGYDPEGLLSTVSSFTTCLIGLLIGDYLRSKTASIETGVNLLLFGMTMIGLGSVLNLWIPLNKPIWSGSFSLVVSGIGTLVLICCFTVQTLRIAKVFTVLGVNALFVYILNGIINISLIDSGHSINGSILCSSLYLLSLWIIALVLYKKRIFIKI
jgi:predicted acyltransferase